MRPYRWRFLPKICVSPAYEAIKQTLRITNFILYTSAFRLTTLPVLLPKRLRQWLLPRQRLAIAEACLIGLVSGLSAVFLKQSVGWLGSWRVQASNLLPPSLVLPAVGLSLGLLCGFLIEFLEPEATGSGIPQIKGVLAQFPIVLNLRVALVKLVSSILSLSAGLTLGRQGPTVHIGAGLAAQLSHWVPTSPEHRRQMIAAGAGAGPLRRLYVRYR